MIAHNIIVLVSFPLAALFVLSGCGGHDLPLHSWLRSTLSLASHADIVFWARPTQIGV